MLHTSARRESCCNSRESERKIELAVLVSTVHQLHLSFLAIGFCGDNTAMLDIIIKDFMC